MTAAGGRRPKRREAFGMATWDDVRRLALGLPGTTEATSRGARAWQTDGKMFVWERTLRRTDLAALRAAAGRILGARTGDLDVKEALLAAEAAAFTPSTAMRLKRQTAYTERLPLSLLAR